MPGTPVRTRLSYRNPRAGARNRDRDAANHGALARDGACALGRGSARAPRARRRSQGESRPPGIALMSSAGGRWHSVDWTRGRLAARTSIALTVAGGLLICGLPVARAWAAPAWLAPVNLAEERQEVHFGPYVATDSQGDAVTVWQAEDGATESSRVAGGSWQPPGRLPGEGDNLGAPCVAQSSGGKLLPSGRRGTRKAN